MSTLNEISTLLQQGRAPKVKELVAKAIEEGIAPQTILEEGLLGGMSVVVFIFIFRKPKEQT